MAVAISSSRDNVEPARLTPQSEPAKRLGSRASRAAAEKPD
ncbi:MAG: hypothetical protein ACREB5_01335 [Sphingomonadaceae bacterium]